MQKPRTVDWSNSSEAMAALDDGILPNGFSVNDAGDLVIPDSAAIGGPFGHLMIIAQFDRVVTASGEIFKDRDGVLRAARMP